MADTDCASESASSANDEERVRRLFQACDTDGDGYIDSHDLLTVCRELSLEDSLDELMLQLGADAQGRISYEQFLQRRLALRPEIDAIKSADAHSPVARDTGSENSQGKLDSWEWDSGARDLSPVARIQPVRKTSSFSPGNTMEKMFKESVKPVAVAGPKEEKTTKTTTTTPPFFIAGTVGPDNNATYVDCCKRIIDDPTEDRTIDIIKDNIDASLRDTLLVHGNNNIVHFDTTYIFKDAAESCVPSSPKLEPMITSSDTEHPQWNNLLSHKIIPADVTLHTGYKFNGSGGLTPEERTYDEPCVEIDNSVIPRSRSWLCCPGSSAEDVSKKEEKSKDCKDSLDGLFAGNIRSVLPEVITRVPCIVPDHERLQQQLSIQSQRYEEQLTELHSVIAELTRKLHQQRAMAITEEDEASDIGTSGHEGSLTCPLDVSELEPTDHDRTYADDLSDTDTKLVMPESPLELPEPKLCGGNKSDTEQSTQLQKEVDMLRAEILSLRSQLESRNENENSLIGGSNVNIVGEKMSPKISNLDSQEDKMSNELYNNDFVKSHIKSSSIIPIHTSCSQNKNIVIEKSQPKLETFKGSSNEKSNDLISENALISQPIAKMAERVRLRRATGDRPVTGSELAQTGICSTQVAEHLVSDLKCQSELQEHLGTETKTEEHAFETEVCRLNSKIDNLKAQNNILTLTLNECKAHCDRLTLLCGKYESNAVALRVALGFSDRAIEAYDVLLALLETELALDQADQVTLDNRTAAESVALQLLARLDENDVSMILDSPWQRNIYASNNSEGEWSGEHETKLRGHVSYLKAQRNVVEGTCVTLESPHSEQPSLAARHGAASQDMRKLDLETAVLMQELMALREDKAELSAKVYHLEKEKVATDLKLSCLETQLRAQTSTLNNIRGQLNDTEALLAIANQQRDRSSYSDAEHAQGIELELIQALARESRLKVRLQELVTTLEQVTKNAEARLLEGRELVADLNQANSTLVQTVDRNHKKYQIRLKKLEQQMISMVERHSVQMQTLKQRIADLEAPANSVSSANSETSL